MTAPHIAGLGKKSSLCRDCFYFNSLFWCFHGKEDLAANCLLFYLALLHYCYFSAPLCLSKCGCYSLGFPWPGGIRDAFLVLYANR